MLSGFASAQKDRPADAAALYTEIYAAQPSRTGPSQRPGNDATVSLEKALKTVSGSGHGRAGPVKSLQTFFIVLCVLQLAAAAFIGVYMDPSAAGLALTILMLGCAVLDAAHTGGPGKCPILNAALLAASAAAAALACYLLAAGPKAAMLSPLLGKGLLAAVSLVELGNLLYVLIRVAGKRKKR